VVAGARVYLSTKRIYGTVRFIGFVNGKEGVWAGIELEQAVGMNNGIVEVGAQ
jgi:dynactin complex subunit